MVCASCVRVIPLWERRLVDLGEFWNWPWGNSGIGLGGKFLIALELAPKWALPAERVVVGAGAWGASLWMGAGALGCTGAELEEFPA